MAETPKLLLPLYEDSDRVDLTKQYNSAMTTLDGAVSNLQTSQAGTATQLETVRQGLDELNTVVTAQGEMITDHSSELQTVDYRLEALEDQAAGGGGGIGGTWKSWSVDFSIYNGTNELNYSNCYVDIYLNEDARLFRISGSLLNYTTSQLSIAVTKLTEHSGFPNLYGIKFKYNLISLTGSNLFTQGAEYRQPLHYPNVMAYSNVVDAYTGYSNGLAIDSSGDLYLFVRYFDSTNNVKISSNTLCSFDTGIRSVGKSDRITLGASSRDLGC